MFILGFQGSQLVGIRDGIWSNSWDLMLIILGWNIMFDTTTWDNCATWDHILSQIRLRSDQSSCFNEVCVTSLLFKFQNSPSSHPRAAGKRPSGSIPTSDEAASVPGPRGHMVCDMALLFFPAKHETKMTKWCVFFSRPRKSFDV
jgi:hypothetical protein